MSLPDMKVSRTQKRLFVIFWLFILAALFWSGFEQAGSSLNLFAERETNRIFGPYRWIGQIGAWLPALSSALPLCLVTWRTSKRDNVWWVGRAGVAAIASMVSGVTD